MIILWKTSISFHLTSFFFLKNSWENFPNLVKKYKTKIPRNLRVRNVRDITQGKLQSNFLKPAIDSKRHQ